MAGPLVAPEGPWVQQGPSTDVDANKLRSTAAAFRRMLSGSMYHIPGTSQTPDLAITQNGAGTGLINYAAGDAFVLGTQSLADQGMYHDYVTANTLDILTANPPHATLDRIDLVIARIRDVYYADASNGMAIEAVTGTPNASPVPPATPASSIVLAQVKIRHSPNSQILTSDITDQRLLAGGKSYRCSIQNNATQAVTSNVFTKVLLQNKIYDIHGDFDAVTNYRYTVPVSGYYYISGVLSWTLGGQVGRVLATIYKNGAELQIPSARGSMYVSTQNTPVNVPSNPIIIPLVATDYIELWAYHLSTVGAGTLNGATGDNANLTIQFIDS